ncbi:carboxypeptidase regulatory-like domain-containing protein [Tsukamurella soli]|uniref:Alpha-amylase n=1 Tax=Tsukamurella soli TaxID=644556 RepID=A0ABP8KEF4_9ACTN
MANDGQDAAIGRVSGMVRRADGTPVPEPTVTVIDPSGRQAARVVGGADGSFALQVGIAGHYVLVASAEGYEPSAAAVIVGATEARIEVVLGRLLAVSGIVMEASHGQPIAGATVTVTDLGGNLNRAAASDPRGSFEISGLAPGQYTLVVTSEGSEPSAQTITVSGDAPTTVTVVLHTVAELTGTVTDGSGGVPVAHSQVVLLDVGGQMVASAVTDETGAYRFPTVIPSDYTVIANGYAPVAATVNVSGGTVVDQQFVLGARAAGA